MYSELSMTALTETSASDQVMLGERKREQAKRVYYIKDTPIKQGTGISA